MKLRNKKTGEIIETDFELSVSVPDDEKLYGNDTYTQIKGYSSIKELSEDWEDYEEPKACYIGRCGTIEEFDQTKDVGLTEMLKEIGNYFETKEEAEKVVEKLKAWKRLKDSGFAFYGKGDCLDTIKFDYGPAGYNNQDFALLFGGEE